MTVVSRVRVTRTKTVFLILLDEGNDYVTPNITCWQKSLQRGCSKHMADFARTFAKDAMGAETLKRYKTKRAQDWPLPSRQIASQKK
eukprot:1558993-Amphidinium_carterae.1